MRILKRCALPLTGRGVVNRIITNLSMLDVVEGGLKRVKLSDGVTEAELQAATESALSALGIRDPPLTDFRLNGGFEPDLTTRWIL